MRNILVIDGNSIINRAFYGVRPLSTHAGKPTNAIFGMVNIISRQLDSIKPAYAAVAFDLKHPTFRHELYAGYKAGRHPTPEDLLAQFQDAKECLLAMGLHVLELQGYEADDIQGTVAAMARTMPDCHAYVLSGDKDLFQLIDATTTVLYAGNTETKVLDRAAFCEKYPGITPEQFVDLKALMGDASDNIPGVAGVGEKTALKLLTEFGTLDAIYENIDAPTIAKGVREKLLRSKDDAYLSRTLATILRSVPLGLTAEDLTWQGFQNDALYAKFTELELHSYITRFHLKPPSARQAAQGEAHSAEERAEATGEAAQPLPYTPVAYTPVDAEQALKLGGKFAFHMIGEDIYLSDGERNWVTDAHLFQLAPLFEGEKTVVCMEGKKLWHTLYDLGIQPSCTFADLSLYAYVLNAGGGAATLPTLASSFLGEVIGEDLPAAHLLWRLESLLSIKIEEISCTKLLREVELPLRPIRAEMEERGFRIDRAGMTEYGQGLADAAERCLASIWEMAGGNFNVHSPKQLGEVLFEKLGLPAPKKKKTGYSTDAETLQKLRGAHPIIDEILLYRQLTKLHSTYAVALTEVADASDRVHTDFKQALTATGRLSSADPNLQNIPIRTPLGRELRRYFIPSEGMVLVDADYSQIELRLLAHLSGDSEMQRAFASGEDIHTATAATAFRIPREEITPDIRKRAKAINFGIVYGIGAYSLSQDLGISVAEAKAYIEAYMQTYPAIGAYLDRTVEDATACGYTETLYGRRRYIPELKAANGMVRAMGRRIAMNAPLQGTAADIMKMAMVRVSRALKKELPSAHLLMQVHDELVLECPPEDAPRAAAILAREMEGVDTLSVPLTVDVVTGDTWLK